MISKKEGLTVGDIIDELSKYPRNMKLYDDSYFDFCSIYLKRYIDSNYPYNRPDELMLRLDITSIDDYTYREDIITDHNIILKGIKENKYEFKDGKYIDK